MAIAFGAKQVRTRELKEPGEITCSQGGFYIVILVPSPPVEPLNSARNPSGSTNENPRLGFWIRVFTVWVVTPGSVAR
jgi:hypothetical protein